MRVLAIAWRGISASKWMLLFILGLLAAGCQTQQFPPKATGLSEEQVIALRELGFTAEVDGWWLNFDAPFLFESDNSQLSKKSREAIAHVVSVLKVMEIECVRVEGYADSLGSTLYNKKLSLRRAEAVAREMERNGLLYRNIDVKGLGTENPVGDNRTKKGRAQNRRVAIIVPVED